MLHRCLGACSTLAAVIALAPRLSGQSVISTHSGVVHFFEGAVYLDDQRLEAHLGKFPTVAQGAELRTAIGRAEVLLTPGVFLRIGERSAVRMVSNDLADTQVEFQSGSVMVDSAEPNPDTSVTIVYKNWKVHAAQKGVYRIDSDPPRLWVLQGAAEVAAGGQPVTVEQGMSVPFAEVLVPEPSSEPPADGLSDWAKGRGQSIVADNAITAQIDEDPATRTPGVDGFIYYPMIGLPIYGLGLGSAYPSSTFVTAQPGFSSIYLPGYTYQPILLGLIGRGAMPYTPYTPLGPGRIGPLPGYGAGRIGGLPGAGTLVPLPRPPVTRPSPVHGGAPRGGAPHVGGFGGGRHR